MQQCLHCGQYNDDSEDYCAYCGEALYIQINHDDSRNAKMDHLYADSIAQEIIDSNTNIFDDELDEVTKELLGENNDNDDNSFIMDIDEYDFDTDNNLSEEDEKLIQIEHGLRNKLRRNKKLESGMGLFLRNIDIILDDYDGPLIVMGEITTNDKLDNKKVQLSVISYDINQRQISKNSTIVKVDHGNFSKFSITLDLDIKETAIIIILPEMIRYDNDDIDEEVTKEKIEIPEDGNQIFIEQLIDIERKIGLTLKNTSVIIKSGQSIEIVGEITIENPDKYHNIKIAATCYDKNNKIIGTQSTKINTKLFLGFDTLSLDIEDINVNNIQRIRLYPTLQ
jgi:polyisoprenoid-binding protein YceI